MIKAPFKLFCPYQIAWMNDPAGVCAAEKSRRIGWTYADAFEATMSRIGSNPIRNYDCWYSATDMTAAEEYIGYVADFAAMVKAVAKIIEDEIEVQDENGKAAKVSVMRVTFDNGLRITAGSSNPNFFRSKGGEVKLDELAFHRDGRAMYKAALASARFWGYPMRFWSSHNGNSYYGTLIDQIQAGKLKASLHSVNIIQAVEQGICERIRMRKEKLSDVPAVDLKYRQEWLDERRAECPDEDVWNEEFMCIRSSDQSSLLSYDLLRGCETANLELWLHSQLTGRLLGIQNRQLYAGFDVGRKHDLSCFWLLEKVGDVFWTRAIRTFSKETFTAQEGFLNTVMPAINRLCIDSTGIGLQMSERLQEKWGKHKVEAINFTAPMKSELAMPLRRLFEDKLIRIPADDLVREDLHSIRKIVTAAGNVRLDADRSETDGHGDRFWSLALAYHAVEQAFVPVRRPLASKPVGW